MIKLVLSDVDGTLIPLGSGKASERTMEAIRCVKAAGVRFGLATGRDVSELLMLFNGSDTAFQTGILSNGKKIYVDGRLERLTLIENEALLRVAREIASYPDTMVTAYPLESDAANTIYCMGVTQDEADRWAQTYSFNGIVVDEFPPVQIIGSTIACNAGQDVLDKIDHLVRVECPEFDLGKPSARWWDILPAGLNKGTALTMLMQILHVTPDEVVMFGDAGNDLAILTAVENSVAVANATPEAKAASRFHIGSVDDEAVADALFDIARATGEGRLPDFMRG